MNYPDPEFLAAAREKLNWPDLDVRFGHISQPATEMPISVPPGFNLVDEPPSPFAKRNEEMREKLASISDVEQSDICPKNNGRKHLWRPSTALVRGAKAKYCRKCSTRRMVAAGDVMDAPRDPNACPKNEGGPHSWRPRNDCEQGKLVQVNLCGKCKTRRQVAA